MEEVFFRQKIKLIFIFLYVSTKEMDFVKILRFISKIYIKDIVI